MNGLYCEFHDVDVLHLIVSANVVNLSVASFTHHEVNSLAVVFHVEPVAYILSFSVNRELFSFQYVVDDKRNELLREVVRTIVVRATCYGDRHVISVMIGHYEKVGACL